MPKDRGVRRHHEARVKSRVTTLQKDASEDPRLRGKLAHSHGLRPDGEGGNPRRTAGMPSIAEQRYALMDPLDDLVS